MNLVFAGAGASKAVNPSEYPTTVEFFERLPNHIKADPLCKSMIDYLNSRKRGDSPIDIEEILWSLGDISKFGEQIEHRKTAVGWAANDRELRKNRSQRYDLQPLLITAPKLREHAEEVTSDINQFVYELYGRLPSLEEVSTCWMPLFQALLEADEWTEIFTTNYDQVLETTFEFLASAGDLPHVETGRIFGPQPYLDTSFWESGSDTLRKSGARGLFTKLHGSVDWRRSRNQIFVGTPLFGGEHAGQVILYPGYKGVPDQAPLDLFHDRFRETSAQAKVFVFIGFSFRDPHINELLRSSVSDEALIITVNPNGLPDSAPFEGKQVRTIGEGFDENSVDQILSTLESSAR